MDPGHIGDSAGRGSSRFRFDRRFDFEPRPSGNAVGFEDETLKVASNAMDYQAATALSPRASRRGEPS